MTPREAGPVKRSAGFYNEIVSGTLDISGIAGTQLSASVAVFEVLLQNDPGSASSIAVGNVNGQHVILTAGSSTTIRISNLNMIYVSVPDNGTATINWLAMA